MQCLHWDAFGSAWRRLVPPKLRSRLLLGRHGLPDMRCKLWVVLDVRTECVHVVQRKLGNPVF